ncbi:MAG: hypothetical protein IT332_11040 [Ardenticatenales bacterium]|nr:hypothetical protein [Ardenticatenales bacterium]
MATHVVSLRLRDEQVERLRRLARRLGRTPSEASAMLIEEALRRAEFALIDFRDSPVGRQAYLQGSTLAVWEVVLVARDHGLSAPDTAGHLEWPVHRVQAALNYAAAFAGEIEAAIADNDAVGWAELLRQVPATTVMEVSPDERRPQR